MDYGNIVLFTDLDGTLFDDQKKVSQKNIDAICHFVSRGGSFGISTGRGTANAYRMLPQLPLNGWNVLFNGSAAYHFGKKKFGAMQCLDRGVVLPLLEWTLENLPQINVLISTPESLLFVSDPAKADDHFVRTHQPMVNVDLSTAAKDPWLKVVLCAYDDSLEKVRLHAIDTGTGAVIDCVYSWDYYLEFLPVGVNKGTCLRQLRTFDETAGKTIIAVGDYYNDLQLLQEADIAVAVGNALPEIKAISDYVICSNNEDALAYLIYELIPQL